MEMILYCSGMLAIGVGVGMISGSLGLGGGILMVPAFVAFVPDMDVHTAKGTSLFIIIFVALLNAWRQNKDLPVKPWGLAAYFAAGSIGGSYVGAWVTTLMPEKAVLALFIVLLGGLAVRTFLLTPHEVHEDEVRRRRGTPVLIGLAAGMVGGATGTGGGMVLVPLALYAALSVNERVVGLSNMVMVATSAAGSVAHFRAEAVYDAPWTVGHVYLVLVPLVFLGAQAGSLLGVRINTWLTLPRRRVVLGVLLLVISARLLLRFFE